ncbi:hypothetical protein LE190_00300 [Massilia oculi]|uniref:Glycosyltransferase RgtA/B/C/D-like domain-containing protein n=1 Tax=Massilia hydrophila TaxID=3044279 RepID=A0ABS7Y4U9_9BURK|nr:hypothetical protein [Massilia oculi]MCA1854368.1 hypothetical protein [Massilia oculi]
MQTPASLSPTPAWRFPLLVALALAALLATYKPYYGGDVVEYTLATVAIADHGSPDIRLEDIARVRALLPGMFTEPFDLLEQGMRAGEQKLYAAFVRGREGSVFPVHYFGYSLLAAGPFKLFEALGIPPFKAFQAVNLLAVFALALALRRFFGSEAKAWLGLGLFMLCGGVLYLHWSSPECVSAACLLAGLLLYASGAPVAGSLLAGLAGQQNPTIVFFFVFAPLFKLWLDYDRALGFGANLRAQLTRRNLAGLAAGAALFALPPLFNLWQFGVPNIIAKLFSDPALVGATRLASFYFDLNQGMIIGVPGLVLALLVLVLRPRADGRARGALLLAALLTLALALPALAVLNWNSGAAGVMRYAFWAAMPLVFALLVLLRRLPRWPAGLQVVLAGLAAIQAVAMLHAQRYDYVHFSPAAVRMLTWAPQYYHPEPEIFAERAGNHDNYIQPDKHYVLQREGVAVKTLVHASNLQLDAQLCGQGARLAPDLPVTPSAYGWRYIDGPLRCVAGSQPQRSFQYDAFKTGTAAALVSGWSTLEANGPGWNGAWSLGTRSRVRLRLEGGPAESLLIAGHYLAPNRQTRVVVNGQDLGWQALDQAGLLPLPPAARAATLDIELEHATPQAPGPGDPRPLAFFLREISVRQLPGKP